MPGNSSITLAEIRRLHAEAELKILAVVRDLESHGVAVTSIIVEREPATFGAALEPRAMNIAIRLSL